MRTTIDLPEDLLRRAKATAALRGIKLKDFIAVALAKGMELGAESSASGQKRPIPVVIPATGQPIPAMTNAEIEALLLQDDLERLGPN